MIGPIFRAPHRTPRASAIPLGIRRRTKNLVTDLFEYALVPFARWERQHLVTEQVTIALRGLPPAFAGYRIVFLTDLHLSPLVPEWWLEQAIAKANALAGDCLLLGGDFMDDDPHYVAHLCRILEPLRAKDGVFAVLGNHDHYVDALGVREQLERARIRELFNASVRITRGADAIAIGGVGDLERDIIDFVATVGSLPEDMPRVVLSHDPDVFAYWPADQRLDLMLSGHTHGGQAWLPVLGPPYVPSQFGFRFLRGLIREGDRQLYVSRGVGASGVPFRWRCPPELTVITLSPA